MHVTPHHELQELLAGLLFSIETVPAKEQRRAVNRACKEAVKWHEERIKRMIGWVRDMEKDIQLHGSVCPECTCRLSEFSTHKHDCSLRAMIVAIKS